MRLIDADGEIKGEEVDVMGFRLYSFYAGHRLLLSGVAGQGSGFQYFSVLYVLPVCVLLRVPARP